MYIDPSDNVFSVPERHAVRKEDARNESCRVANKEWRYNGDTRLTELEIIKNNNAIKNKSQSCLQMIVTSGVKQKGIVIRIFTRGREFHNDDHYTVKPADS